MAEDQNIEQSQEDSKSESPQEVNETISQEQTVEQSETTNPKSEIQNQKSKTWKYITIQICITEKNIGKNIFLSS